MFGQIRKTLPPRELSFRRFVIVQGQYSFLKPRSQTKLLEILRRSVIQSELLLDIVSHVQRQRRIALVVVSFILFKYLHKKTHKRKIRFWVKTIYKNLLVSISGEIWIQASALTSLLVYLISFGPHDYLNSL